jgi:uncharacterized membrane protein
MNSTDGLVEPAQSEKTRIPSIDALRGLIMVLMAIDHARYFIAKDHPGEFSGWIAFLNVTKYPPSIAFILLTLGVDLLLLGILSKLIARKSETRNPLLTFGRTAFFFYIAHLYVYALIGLFFPQGSGLILMYSFWLFGLLLLYPLCRWFGNFKQGTPPDSLWRFF